MRRSKNHATQFELESPDISWKLDRGCGIVDDAAQAFCREGRHAAKIGGFGQSGNPYDELGVKTVINCEGTMTVLGGSILRPELEAVMAQAGRHFVHIADLEVAAGNRIAEMLKLPEGYTAAGYLGRRCGHAVRPGGHPYR